MFGVFQEDCLKILKTMSSNVVDLIYLDPPFYTGRIQTQKTRDNSYEYKFIDRWENLEAYIEFLNLE
jgi:site-specific DNA-methyltransferase (adenine-specific)